MALSLRTATKGVLASGATGSITLPTGSATGDVIVVGFANAGTTGPALPAGWTNVRATDSAGTGQSITCFWAPFSAGLTLSFVNAASVAAWTCQCVTGVPNTGHAIDTSTATSATANNATLPTGAPTTGTLAGDLELLFYAFTSAATISVVAAGSTIDATQANSTSISCVTGHNNTTALGASTATTAFSQTLSASNTRKTGVGILILSSNPQTVTPPVKALTLTEFAPTVSTPRLVTPPKTSLVLNEFAPTVTITSNVKVTPPTTALVLTEFAPTVSAPCLVTPAKTSLILTSFAPVVSISKLVTPPKTSLTLTSFAPIVSTPRLVTPSKQSLVLTEFAPTVLTPRLVTPSKTSLILTSFAPTVSTPRLVTPPKQSLTLTSFAPTVTVSSGGSSVLVTPGKTALVLTTFSPSVTASQPGSNVIINTSNNMLRGAPTREQLLIPMSIEDFFRPNKDEETKRRKALLLQQILKDDEEILILL